MISLFDNILIFSLVCAPFMGAFAFGGAIIEYRSNKSIKNKEKYNRHKNDLNSILYSLMINDLYNELISKDI